MNLNRIDVKLAITYILVILIIILPLGFVTNQIFTGFYYTKVQEETNDLSQHYAELISKNRDLQIVELLELVSQISQVPMYIVNFEGEIIANSNVLVMIV